MHFLEYYYKTIIKYDFINKFQYNSVKKIPKLKKIVLNFECKNFNIKLFVSTLLALELLTSKPAWLTKANVPNIFLKIQKGQPTGCKIVLKKFDMYQFLSKLFIDIIPTFKTILKFKKNKKNINSFTFTLLKNSIFFSEIHNHFNLIKRISNLNITFVSNSKNQNELFFLLKALKLPIKNIFVNVTQFGRV